MGRPGAGEVLLVGLDSPDLDGSVEVSFVHPLAHCFLQLPWLHGFAGVIIAL